jgi:hypothetical protein
MPRLRQRKFTFAFALCLSMLALVPAGHAATGPTLPPLPWCGATGPTLPPLPWCGATGPTLPPLPWDGLV